MVFKLEKAIDLAKAPYRTKGIVIETTTVYRHLEKMLKEGVVVGKEKQMDTKRKRAFSVAVGILFLFVIFASLFYIAEEENHNCTGEDCPICANIHMAEQNIKSLGTGTIVHSTMNLVLLLFLVVVAGQALFVSITSLVSQKIRLNN